MHQTTLFEPICITSDEESGTEESEPKRRKIVPLNLNSKTDDQDKELKDLNTVVCLDSDDDDDCDDSKSEDLLVVTRVEKFETSTCESEKDDLAIEKATCDSTSDGIEMNSTVVEENSPDGKENDDTVIKQLGSIEDLPPLVVKYLKTCHKSLEKGKIETFYNKYPTMVKMFREFSDEFKDNKVLVNFLKEQTSIADKSTRGAIISFKDVYFFLKNNLKDIGVEMSKKDMKNVKKLEKLMQKLLEKLKELDNLEVNFDDDYDCDSVYIKHDAYSKRLSKVYEKYCKILKKNPYSGRLTHSPLKFVSSNYKEINIAITKKYKNNSIFPSYDEFSTFIQKVVEENNLNLTSGQLKSETDFCFGKLGDLLQIRRKKDLYEAHCSLVLDKDEDPAKKDRELDKLLRTNYKEGLVKIEQVCEDFVKKQEQGVDDEEIEIKTDDDEESD